MSAQSLATEFVVLDRRASGDAWIRLVVFSAVEGRMDCMQRATNRPEAAAPALDLFDWVRATLETRNQGRTWFVREAIPLRRRSGLGSSYQSLAFACRFARVLAQTPVHDESREGVFTLLARALDAWESAVRPDAVYFKSLFLLARDEGFPVREAWIRGLNRTDGQIAESVLREPAAGQTTIVDEVARLTSALEAYLAHDHDFRFGA